MYIAFFIKFRLSLQLAFSELSSSYSYSLPCDPSDRFKPEARCACFLFRKSYLFILINTSTLPPPPHSKLKVYKSTVARVPRARQDFFLKLSIFRPNVKNMFLHKV